MIVAGLTGGIGSGKSEVARIWKACGAFVMDADTTAKSLMATDPLLREGLIEAFGDAVFLPDGSLNRAYLSKEAFEKGRVEELNRLVHPAVHRETDRLIEQHRALGTAVFVKEAALLLKYGRPENLDVVVLCEADEQKRLERVKQRDGLSPEQIAARMGKQKGMFDAVDPGRDIIIRNNGSHEALEQQALQVWKQLTAGQ